MHVGCSAQLVLWIRAVLGGHGHSLRRGAGLSGAPSAKLAAKG